MSQTRWAVLGAARIAASSFVPAVTEATGGTVDLVAARDGGRAHEFAAANGVRRGVEGYSAAVSDPDIDAVYVALPHHLHAEWTIAALRAGKAVLCEKPLTPDAATTQQVLDVAQETGGLLWEAYVFPFHPQSRLVEQLARDELGGSAMLESRFDFELTRADDFRLDPVAAGGALMDVGGYPVRLARMLWRSEPTVSETTVRQGPTGVDLDTDAVVSFPGDRHLRMNSSVDRPFDTLAVLHGDGVQVKVTNPFHPTREDVVEVWRGGRAADRRPAPAGSSFGHAVRHIHRALAGEVAPENLAVHDASGQARAVDLVRSGART